jgi:acetyl esterase/lipase
MQTSIPLPLARILIERGMAWVRLPTDVVRETVSANGVPCEWVIPHESSPDQVLLYFHGGGFVFGLTPLHLHMGAHLAKLMSIRILMVDYRLAPDHPFPAALDDCVTAYRWLLEQGLSPHNIVLAGDSAGGNLTLTVMMKVRESGSVLPAAAACLSPVTDLSKHKNTRQDFKDPLLPSKAVKLYSRSYVGQNDAHDPLISPVYGNLRGLPPLLVHVGEDEILLEDAKRITSLAISADVDVRLEIYSRMWHVWQLFLSLPQAVQSLGDIAQFFKSHLGDATQESSSR